MGLFTSKELNSLESLFLDQIQDLYDAEQRLTKALPKMANAASNPAQGRVPGTPEGNRGTRQAAGDGVQGDWSKAKGRTCEAMKGLVAEGEEVLDATGDPDVKDAALIAAAQRVEHYEMAGYGTVRNFARRLGHNEAVTLLQATLDEEKAADKTLTDLAESTINVKAQRS